MFLVMYSNILLLRTYFKSIFNGAVYNTLIILNWLLLTTVHD